MQICDINTLWPSDAIWQHRSGSTVAQVKAWCLTAPSHYLNQWWLLISEVVWHPSEGNFTASTQDAILKNELEKYTLRLLPNPPGSNELMCLCQTNLRVAIISSRACHLVGISEVIVLVPYHYIKSLQCIWRQGTCRSSNKLQWLKL